MNRADRTPPGLLEHYGEMMLRFHSERYLWARLACPDPKPTLSHPPVIMEETPCTTSNT